MDDNCQIDETRVGELLARERLEVIPWAQRTVEEQARYEQASG